MVFWTAEKCDDADNSNTDNARDRTRSCCTSNEEGSTQQLLHGPTDASSSPSKQAVRIMNVASGLCADPLHFHSFATVGGDLGGGWMIPSPKSLFAGAFQKCAACHGRLGGSARVADVGGGGGGTSAASPEMNSSAGMLRCVACGVYAHRSCAFNRPAASGEANGNIPPPCEVNLAVIEKSFGTSREKLVEQMGVPRPTSAAESSSWSIFGKRSHLASSEPPLKSDNGEKVMPQNPKKNGLNEGETQSNEEDWGDTVLEEKKEPVADESETKPIQPPGVIETSMNLIRKTSETTKNIPKASAIGMVAGGAAGLAIAGPAGILVGSQIGRTVLAVGAAVEGGVGMGVLVMSLAAAANFSLSSSSEKERELKLNSNLILVRPDIAVDPVWGEYADEARRFWTEKNKDLSPPSTCGSFGLGSLFQSTNATKEDMRYRKDSDIIKADATELPMREKVFLLVNRILNDKMSLPGYLYRYLIVKHKRRILFGDDGSAESDAEDSAVRLSRQDAHGVIKYVTATLLEVRPGLASSPAMTELSAGAVEVLVFGELYDDVFGEIMQQTEEKDENLSAKVRELRERCEDGRASLRGGDEVPSISQSAIAALGSLPRARTPTDKLSHCVEFLERVSEHFSSSFRDECIDADTLLIMVCQHIVAADVRHLRAEVAFIEEFSRDEQLLSGKEGYALITLQASLHYLDCLDELPSDLSLAHTESDEMAVTSVE
eukprot:CAMPEP_0172542856 /NCGR_PEP_ID=MMETSP1067-20121228/13378_1 /TAXON_ID=265564 ORGANISM="Thalassiosira punctigera, Strain Tpunct2005C2" /NCGR_SAMPLE_ID=MMETSP1067 /ASSEMBLY_ACC=CAM_ASM_000444 /LENGTH=718 /DNA_ID=CAMNT_0013329159 /DNA_START=69 /DNA_END=2225 /DNA_ORIENTATION=+